LTGARPPHRRGTVIFRHLLALAIILLPSLSHSEVSTIRIGIQPGMTYLALNVMNHERMLERRAQDDGSDLRVEWIVSANGAVLNDGVLSNNIDIAGTGIPAFVTLWAKGRGTVNVKGIAAYGSLPGMLISRDPNVRSIKDFTDADRIAVPAPKASIQAILLEMMAEKTWGPGQHDKLDPLMVGLGHPDALIAMLSGRSEINAHFSSSPYYDEELKMPGAHVVLTKEDIFPGPLTHGMLWTTAKFHDQNPRAMREFRAALDDAMALIHADPARAAEAYLALAREKVDAAEATEIIRKLNARFEATPRGILVIATFMHSIGMIKTAPTRLQDMFFEEYWVADGS
jgi:NitT/TauT family transport system substrate-binding protein